MSYPRYPAYKASGVEWLGEVPAHWEVLPLKRQYEVKLGKMLTTDQPSKEFSLSPYLRAANILWSGVDLSDLKEMYFSNDERELLKLEKGDLLVSEGGDVGRSCIWQCEVNDCYIQNSVNRVRSLGNGSTHFLYYLMSALKSVGYIDLVCNKATIAHFTAEKVQAVPIPFPPLAEQRAIAAFLDCETAQIDALIAKLEQLIALLQEKRHALISHAVTKGLDPTVPMKDSGVEWLGEVPSHWEVGQSRRLFVPRQELALHEDIQLSATQAFGVIPQDEYELRTGTKVTKVFKNLDKRRHVEVDDFVISMRSFQGGLERAWAQGCIRSSYVVLKPTGQVDTDFFAYLFKSRAYISALQATGDFLRDGQDLNYDNFCHVPLACPPIDEQRAIGAFLKSETALIDALIGKIELLIGETGKVGGLLGERRAALITAAVTGAIDVR